MTLSATIPRIGVPYRTRKEELTDTSGILQKYLDAVGLAGGEPVAISLGFSPTELGTLADSLDAIVLSGSPADVDPSLFQAEKDVETAPSDPDRERTDFALIEHSLTHHIPLLAICYGIQSLNVFLGGSLIQDIPSALHSNIQHDWEQERGDPETFHSARIEPGSRLARIAGTTNGANEIRVNSSHHQSILDPGRELRVVARAPDGVIEAIEWTGDENWITGVQWHPERMVEADSLAQRLFRDLIAAANMRRAEARP